MTDTKAPKGENAPPAPFADLSELLESCDDHNRVVRDLVQAHDVGEARIMTSGLIYKAYALGLEGRSGDPLDKEVAVGADVTTPRELLGTAGEAAAEALFLRARITEQERQLNKAKGQLKAAREGGARLGRDVERLKGLCGFCGTCPICLDGQPIIQGSGDGV
jgi:hypothetical protein